jgi:hypothetical protein
MSRRSFSKDHIKTTSNFNRAFVKEKTGGEAHDKWATIFTCEIIHGE